MDDIDINKLDYKWVDDCNDKNRLRKAIKLLKDDGINMNKIGGYYPDLEKYIEEKLKKIDKKFVSQTKPIENVTEEEKRKYKGDINDWENNVREMDKILLNKNENSIYEEENHSKISQIEKKKLAENEKIKGNDLMKTKDFNDAVKHYTSSIKLDPIESTTYCNRALAYIKIKQFENGLNDCNKAIEIKADYTKAYYRRALCLVGLKKFEDAFNDLVFLLSDSPNNNEILDEIKNTKEKWLEFVGKDEYQKYESTLNKRIENANKGNKEAKKQNQESQTKRIQIEQSTNNDSEKNKKPVPETRKEFKKVKITEENTEEDSVALERKFEDFWKTKNEVAKNFEQMYKQEKFGEILEIARVNLSDCQNFLPELTTKPNLKSKLENKIAELNSFIQLCNEKLKLSGTNNKEAEIKDQNEKVKKFYKTPTIGEEKMEKATKIAEKEMSMEEFPKTANGFEKAFSSLKKNNEAFYKFLYSFDPNNLVSIFGKIEMSYDLVAGIINCQKAFGLCNDESFFIALKYFSCISQTKKFNLMKSFLKGPIREEMKLFIQEGKLKFKLNNEIDLLIGEIEKAFF